MPLLAPTIRPPAVHLACAILRNVVARPRLFTSSPVAGAKTLPPRRVILESEITESFLKGTGPGGQKINKTSSAVQLKHLPTGIVVKCQDTRSRSQNRKTARRLLSERIEELELGEGARTRMKAREVSRKKKSADKKKRRKYRALESGKEGEEDEEELAGGEPQPEPETARESEKESEDARR